MGYHEKDPNQAKLPGEDIVMILGFIFAMLMLLLIVLAVFGT